MKTIPIKMGMNIEKNTVSAGVAIILFGIIILFTQNYIDSILLICGGIFVLLIGKRKKKEQADVREQEKA